MGLPLKLLLPILVAFGTISPAISVDYMTTDDTPTPGPEKDTVYQPGTPGGDWNEEEVASTKRRIMQLIDPDWKVKVLMGVAQGKLAMGKVTENTLMRLVFHDCIPYMDGTGGCDGCMNWHGMDAETPSPFIDEHKYAFDPINATDNKDLDEVAEKLEVIYTTLDWPIKTPSLEVSLHQSGKSRADLWQLAGLVALEQALERANRACDLDFHARQQVTLLEGRDKCEIKLNKPLKFLTGRKDCISDDSEGRGYVTTKEENQPKLFSDGKEIIDYGRNMFGMDAKHWAALQGIHGAVHQARIGVKYTWFGPGYISNVLFKMIANKPMYKWPNTGGDLAFMSCSGSSNDEEDKDDDGTGGASNVHSVAIGDKDGKPLPLTGWRASCMYAWNTDEGGPCFLRPVAVDSFDAPNPDKIVKGSCVKGLDSEGNCIIALSKCKDAKCDANNVVSSKKTQNVKSEAVGPWNEGLSKKEKSNRHSQGWSNQFGFPWELGMFWNLTVGGVGQRAIGCPGLDEPFGSLKTGPTWPFRNNKSPIWASPAMQCGLNDYAPDGGPPMHQIIDELASDNEYFADTFLEGWQQMTSNGYSSDELQDGPDNGWLGHYSLTQQGVDIPDFETYISKNAPVTFTDPKADPYVCGHRGHVTTSCGFRFSEYFAIDAQKGSNACSFDSRLIGSNALK